MELTFYMHRAQLCGVAHRIVVGGCRRHRFAAVPCLLHTDVRWTVGSWTSVGSPASDCLHQRLTVDGCGAPSAIRTVYGVALLRMRTGSSAARCLGGDATEISCWQKPAGGGCTGEQGRLDNGVVSTAASGFRIAGAECRAGRNCTRVSREADGPVFLAVRFDFSETESSGFGV